MSCCNSTHHPPVSVRGTVLLKGPLLSRLGAWNSCDFPPEKHSEAHKGDFIRLNHKLQMVYKINWYKVSFYTTLGSLTYLRIEPLKFNEKYDLLFCFFGCSVTHATTNRWWYIIYDLINWKLNDAPVYLVCSICNIECVFTVVGVTCNHQLYFVNVGRPTLEEYSCVSVSQMSFKSKT